MIGARAAFRGEQEILQVGMHVLALAVDLDEVAALGHVLDRAPVLAQGGAVLVEIRHLQVGAGAHFALIRGQFAQQQLQQRGLAAAVGADQADAVAAQDGGGKIAHHAARAEGETQVLGLDHLLAGGFALRRLHAHVAAEFAALGALAAHRFQSPHPALVAGTPRLDALADPHFFLRQQLVEARVFLRLRIEPLLAAALVVGPVARPAADLATVDLDDARGQGTQEAPVVGDEHHTCRSSP